MRLRMARMDQRERILAGFQFHCQRFFLFNTKPLSLIQARFRVVAYAERHAHRLDHCNPARTPLRGRNVVCRDQGFRSPGAAISSCRSLQLRRGGPLGLEQGCCSLGTCVMQAKCIDPALALRANRGMTTSTERILESCEGRVACGGVAQMDRAPAF